MILILGPILIFSLYYYFGDLRSASYLFNAVNHFMLTFYAFTIYRQPSEDLYLSCDKSEFLATWLRDYILIDLVVMLIFGSRDWIYYLHHILTWILMDTMRDNFMHDVVPIVALFEVSSIPLNLRYFLLNEGYNKESNIVRYQEFLFIVSFFLFRFCFGSFHIYNAVNLLNSSKVKLFWSQYILPHATLILMMIFHFIWVKGILKKIRFIIYSYYLKK